MFQAAKNIFTEAPVYRCTYPFDEHIGKSRLAKHIYYLHDPDKQLFILMQECNVWRKRAADNRKILFGNGSLIDVSFH